MDGGNCELEEVLARYGRGSWDQMTVTPPVVGFSHFSTEFFLGVLMGNDVVVGVRTRLGPGIVNVDVLVLGGRE
jgi:hypothetical protein